MCQAAAVRAEARLNEEEWIDSSTRCVPARSSEIVRGAGAVEIRRRAPHACHGSAVGSRNAKRWAVVGRWACLPLSCLRRGDTPARHPGAFSDRGSTRRRRRRRLDAELCALETAVHTAIRHPQRQVEQGPGGRSPLLGEENELVEHADDASIGGLRQRRLAAISSTSAPTNEPLRPRNERASSTPSGTRQSSVRAGATGTGREAGSAR